MRPYGLLKPAVLMSCSCPALVMSRAGLCVRQRSSRHSVVHTLRLLKQSNLHGVNVGDA